MIFGILIDGQIIEAPQNYTSDKGKHIENFPEHLELMYTHSFFDRMYGYKRIEDLIKVTNEEKIKKLEEENEKLKIELEELSLHTIEGNIDSDFRLSILEINTMSLG